MVPINQSTDTMLYKRQATNAGECSQKKTQVEETTWPVVGFFLVFVIFVKGTVSRVFFFLTETVGV